MRIINRKGLFLGSSLSAYCRNRSESAKSKIRELTFDRIQGLHDYKIVDKFYEEYKTEAPIINIASNTCPHEPKEKNVVYHIPFIGKKELFTLHPSKLIYPEPYGLVTFNEIIVEYSLEDDSKIITDEFNDNFNNIIRRLEIISNDCKTSNQSLHEMIEINVKAKYKEFDEKDKIYRGL